VSMAKEEEPKKEKIYVDKPSDAPQGADVKRGKRGGYYYYETKKSEENVSENKLEDISHIKKCAKCNKPVKKCGSCNKPVGKESLRNDRTLRRMLERLETSLRGTHGDYKHARMVEEIMDYIY